MALPDADGQTCPNCGEPADSNAVRCPACETPLLGGFDTDAVAAQLDAIDGEATRAPRWAVALTGLALGIAISPLVVFTVVLAGVELSLAAFAGLGLAGWLLPAAYLSRFPNPSAALARGLYLVVAGVGAVLVTLALDSTTAEATVGSTELLLVVGGLAIPAIVAVLLARRVAGRAARQARGDPGRLHELAGLGDQGDEQRDETDG
ncbi:zinc ribbon domain-containing protein [Halomicroarcula sp. GCM10025324]|uniref:zinc ribbon domain-containing protein n=1 Tax=Haloarcula TaxID=2237 RepID=UPI0023E8D586|nr:zinc ribbon domain-containing protein [Halomicroarcula sp. ZS-22-S1]